MFREELMTREYAGPIAAFAFSLALLLTGCAQKEHGEDAGSLRILNPADGGVFFTNRQIDVDVRFIPTLSNDELTASVAAVNETTGVRTEIIAGEIRTPGKSSLLTTPWVLQELEPGPYELTVSVEYNGRAYADSVNLVVRAPPTVSVSVDRDDQDVFVFNANAIPSAEADIDRYLWHIGSTAVFSTVEPVLTHDFSGAATATQVIVEVFDTSGGSAMSSTIPVLFDCGGSSRRRCPPPPLPFCGCQNMVIQTSPAATSGVYCDPRGGPPGSHFAAAPPPAGPGAPRQCRPGEQPYVMPLGSQAPTAAVPNFGFTFEVVASLLPGSTPRLCAEWQRVRSTILVGVGATANITINNKASKAQPVRPPAGQLNLPRPGGQVSNVKIEPNGAPVPQSGSGRNFGADDYVVPSSAKVHEATVIRWVDEPKVGAGAGIGSVSDVSEFLTYVGTPARGVCWCRFKVNNSWDAATGAASGRAALIDGQNCQLP